MLASLTEQYSRLRLKFFVWRSNIELWKRLSLALGGAIVTGLLAQIKIYLPWTPVPIVGSTFGIVFSAVLLGKNWGGISALIYVVLGVLGVPWFAGFSGGLNVIFGPTGGYLIGFILAGFFVGYLVDLKSSYRRFFPLTFIMIIAHILIMYIPGLIHLGIWLTFIKGKPFNLIELLFMGAIPFLLGDVIKSIIAALIANIITPKEDYIGQKK